MQCNANFGSTGHINVTHHPSLKIEDGNVKHLLEDKIYRDVEGGKSKIS